MKKPTTPGAGETGRPSPLAGAREAAREAEAGGADVSRRSFLYSLGALALSGCGAGAFDTPSSTSSSSSFSPRLLATSASGFAHPALLHTQADFDRMVAKATTAPWSGSWNLLLANSHAKLSYTPSPVAIVYRGSDGVHAENYNKLYNDIAAAYACALRWKISGDTAYADKAIQIMNVWSSTLTTISGNNDQFLAAGIYGYEFANAGEIMRSYAGWAAADFARFQGMMRNIFYPLNHTFLVNHVNLDPVLVYANWDLCNMASIMAIGVLCDDQALFDEAVAYFKNGLGNGANSQATFYIHPGYLGQWQESGRDQGHNTLGIALMGAFCEMAWNQGVDLYGYDNNRFLMGAEYVAKANLIESGTSYYTVPYVAYKNHDVNQTVLSTSLQGTVRPCWALVYNHYVNRKGLAAPYSKKFAVLIQPEGGGGNYSPNSDGYDQLGYGTLTCTRDPIAAGADPSGLSACVSAGAVVLSWWGGAYATGYSVKRALVSGGPYTTVASGITDLLSYTDSGLADGSYYYVVTASTPSGESGPSNEVKASAGIALHTRLTFDEGSGSVANDSSGNGHAGSLAGGSSWVAGRQGGAVALDGTSGYVALPPDIMTDVGDFTISTWVYWNAARTWDRVFDFGFNNNHYLMMTGRDASGFLRFAVTVNGRDGEQFIQHNAALPRGAWTHVAVTLSGRNATFYLNGAVIGTHSNMFLAPCQLRSTSQNWIGRSQNSSHPYFNGKIDDFRVYRGALSAEMITAIVNDVQLYADVGAAVGLVVEGATYNRTTQRYVGGVTLTNNGPALPGPFRLRLDNLTSGTTLDNASGVDGGAPYVNVAAGLAAGASLTVELIFNDPARTLFSFTPKLFKNAF